MTQTLATTTLGTYEGVESDGVRIFRGVRYALPPTGERRFAPAQRLTERFERRSAWAHGPIAPQLPSRLNAVMGDFAQPTGEDCLTLTLWAPADARNLPVLVWIHGGAWMSGAGSLDWYDGALLAREGRMIVVGVNHRLGALGYLHHPGVGAGNLGTGDVAMALGWIGAEIAAFGGDPGRITVAGQSAGAYTIGRLIADATTRGLFRRAILQSGGFGREPLSPIVATARATIFGGHLGLDLTRADAAGRLRETPVDRLLAAQAATARAIAGFADTMPPFTPMLAGGGSAVALRHDIAVGAEGMGLMIGATRDEAHAFFALDAALDAPDRAQVAARATALTGQDDALEQAAQRHPGGTLRDLIADITTDRIYRQPAMRLAEAVSGRGGRVFTYQFDWAAPVSRFGACHCIELPFTFGTFDAYRDAPMLVGGRLEEMAALSARMRRHWAAFVHTGDPALAGDWAPYDADRRWTMIFGSKVGQVGDPAGLDKEGSTP